MKKPKMNKPSKNVVLFIIIAFLLPLMIAAKLLSSLIIGEHNSFFGAVSCK